MVDFSEAPPVDVATLMPRTEAEMAIMGFDTRIAALEAKKSLTQVATATVGETTLVGLSLGVRRFAVAVPGILTTDRIVLALTGAPTNGTIQDAYVSTNGTVSIGILVPALGIGATISVPLAIYRVA